jgi:SAM-dependent methyltransferase
MKRRLLDMLACPRCGQGLAIAPETGTDDATVEDGDLVCTQGHHWTIERGVPRLAPQDLPEPQRRTAEAFGWEWTHFDEQHPQFEAQFLDWVAPLRPEFFRGKRVLDAGCGTGRHAYYAASYGALEVVALDLSSAVETARRVLAPFDNVNVVQGDLLRPPLRTVAEGGGFDLIYSIGVLHHLPVPREGFASLVRFLRPGGTIAVWVYGYENNGVVRNIVEPLRRATTRLPHRALNAVAYPFSLAFHGIARGVYRPLHGTSVGARLPLSEYLNSVADFTYRHNHAIVYDQLVAPTAAYIRGAELRSWFEDAGLEDVELSHRHGNSWRARARKPMPSESS